MNSEQDRILFEAWYRQYADVLYRSVCRRMDRQDAEDAVQETFRIVWERGNLAQIDPPLPWLRAIARNVCRNQLREQAKWTAQRTAGGELPEVPWEDEPDVELLYAGILKPQDLHILKLLAVDGDTCAEAAGALGLSPEACRKRAKRAALVLRRKLGTAWRRCATAWR